MMTINRIITRAAIARPQVECGRRFRRCLGLAAFMALPAIVWAAGVAVVTSVTVSPAEVTSGSSSTGTVSIDALPAKGTITAQLASSNPSVATVPSSVSFTSSLTSGTSKTFTIQSVSGASGCTQISAQVGTTPAKRRVFFVRPATTSVGSVSFSSQPAVGGQTLTGSVQIIPPGGAPVSGGTTIQLSSSDPAVATVPASATATVTAGEGTRVTIRASFPIITRVTDVPTCTVISGTFSGRTARALLKAVPVGG